jgi:hypothetical protein
MAFQRTGSQEDLRAGMTDQQLEEQATEYRAHLGGWYPVEDKPLPGAPLEGPRTS